jgi:hypothetical protein
MRLKQDKSVPGNYNRMRGDSINKLNRALHKAVDAALEASQYIEFDDNLLRDFQINAAKLRHNADEAGNRIAQLIEQS